MRSHGRRLAQMVLGGVRRVLGAGANPPGPLFQRGNPSGGGAICLSAAASITYAIEPS
ncbi:hypothetical protein [Lysobacter gummosus]|uniref:hypothetical protein n=1 Tax=Lysobacter gummosus TaxID=262324 RepID=UPI0036270C29